VEVQEKVCSDLFLGFRSRRNEEFVSYFTGTIGSVPQGPNLSAEDDFRLVAEALLDPERWQDVKTLAMLAASASSYTPRDRQDDNTSKDKESDQ
jgi:CRISPR-associated protein Cmx8